MRIVIQFEHGPSWRAGVPAADQGEPMRAHHAKMRELYEAGVLLMGGPYDRGGGMAVLECKDLDEGRQLAAADPAVRAGLLGFEAHQHLVFFDALTKTSRPFPQAAQIVFGRERDNMS